VDIAGLHLRLDNQAAVFRHDLDDRIARLDDAAGGMRRQADRRPGSRCADLNMAEYLLGGHEALAQLGDLRLYIADIPGHLLVEGAVELQEFELRAADRIAAARDVGDPLAALASDARRLALEGENLGALGEAPLQ